MSLIVGGGDGCCRGDDRRRLWRSSKDDLAFLLGTSRQRFFQLVGVLVIFKTRVIVNKLIVGREREGKEQRLSKEIPMAVYSPCSIRPCGDGVVQPL